MSNLCAGVGRGQMEVLADRVAARRDIYKKYHAKLSGIAGISFCDEPEGYFSNRWLSTILVDSSVAGKSREDLRLALEAENIESRPLWKPMHLQPVFAGSAFYGDGTSERLFGNGLCLPSGSNMTDGELGRVFDVLDKMFK